MSSSPLDEKTSVTDPIDAVFVIGTGSKNNNEELKYALRNLDKHCPFVRDVYISGECPSWINTDVVHHLKWPDRFKHAKDANIIDKLRHACEHAGIAKNILFCSDDQFQTRVCSWDDFKPRWLRKYTESDPWYESRKRIWHTRLHNTLERDRLRRLEQNLDATNVYYYQPHMWMQIDRDKFIEYAKWSDYPKREDTIIASGYFNFIDAKGEPNFDHVFIGTNYTWPANATHIAYTDPSFSAAMVYLKKEFPNPCRFELAYKGNSTEQVSNSARSDLEIISDIKQLIYKEPAWSSLIPEIVEAEKMREQGVPGWKRVWNDIIHRWNNTTEKGKLHIPITTEKNDAVKEIINAYRNNKLIMQNDNQSSSHCTKCEERKRKALAEAAHKKAMEVSQAKGVKSVLSEGCKDCAVEHLSIAAAYLNSNLARPTTLDIELARGEVSVAAQHLLALNKMEEYNKCIKTLDSIYSENSTFSVTTVRGIMKQVLGTEN